MMIEQKVQQINQSRVWKLSEKKSYKKIMWHFYPGFFLYVPLCFELPV